MTRIALVAGGTRGIGSAICMLLKGADYKVVAVHHGNDQAAERFKRHTGIPVYKWCLRRGIEESRARDRAHRHSGQQRGDQA